MTFRRLLINRKEAVNAASIASGLLVVVITALFVMSLPAYAMAGDNALRGEVIAVDTHAKTITVKPMEAMSSDAFTFSVGSGTNVLKCAQNRTFLDIGVGQQVTVTYYEKEGKAVARSIDIASAAEPVIVACNFE